MTILHKSDRTTIDMICKLVRKTEFAGHCGFSMKVDIQWILLQRENNDIL